MKSVSAPLLAASKSPSRVPYIPITVENKVDSVRRQDWTILDATSWTASEHDIAVSSDGTVHRVRIESGAIKYQRLTNPATGPYSSWTDLETSMGALRLNRPDSASVAPAGTVSGASTLKY